MRTKPADRRVQRTRKHLHEALLSRILEKRYDAITVQEILDRADIGRSTFYTHFRGKDELLVSGFQRFKDSLESVDAAPSAASRPSYERIVDSSLAMFEHAARYRDVHRALHGSRAESLVRRNLHAVFYDVIGRRVEIELRGRTPRGCRVPPDLLTRYLVSTQIAVLNWWTEAREPMAAEDADAAYRRLVLPVLASVFD
ncbi:MAG TPA: TetR/AcrR family transcriptional regulator [Gammaproteobacteria bacterium]|nr:TetR/AcrR family transcriptional regulator [Gammaproteobacteria bacterium]